jgi:hypothetical protein
MKFDERNIKKKKSPLIYHGNRGTKIMRLGDVRYCFAMAILVIKFPNEVWEFIVFAAFLFIIIIIILPYGAACLTSCKYPFPLKSFHF